MEPTTSVDSRDEVDETDETETIAELRTSFGHRQRAVAERALGLLGAESQTILDFGKNY